MRVLVTGSTGFLGKPTVKLLLEKGAEVIAFVRPTSNVDWLQSQNGVKIATGYLTVGDSVLRESVNRATHIAHLAGGALAAKASDFATNNAGTTNALIDAMRTTQYPERFVFVSSLAARGPSPSKEVATPKTDDSPVTLYGKAKLVAEKELEKLRNDTSVFILRPPAIYGPGDFRMLGVYRAVAKGLVLPLSRDAKSTSFVYVDDCAAAIVSALDCPDSKEPHYVEDGVPRTTQEIIATIGSALGTSPKLVRVPRSILSVAATVSEGWGKLRRQPAFFTRDKVLEMTQGHWLCESSAFRSLTNWTPSISFTDGVKRAAEAYRADGLLP